MMRNHGALWFFAVSLLSAFLCAMLVVVFWLVTVRRLRKNPETRHSLGIYILPCGDAMNVAIAVTWPRRLLRMLDHSPAWVLFANTDLMYRHTSVRERCLARACHGLELLSFATLLFYAALLTWG